MLQVQIGTNFQAFNQRREQTEKNVYVAHGNDCCACTYLIFITEPGAFPLYPSCGCISLGPLV